MSIWVYSALTTGKFIVALLHDEYDKKNEISFYQIIDIKFI